MSTINQTGSNTLPENFFKTASEVLLNLSTTDSQLIEFLNNFYNSKEGTSEGGLQTINFLMNKRSQITQLMSNLEDKRHNSAMSVIANLK